jgi:hypothetical protein
MQFLFLIGQFLKKIFSFETANILLLVLSYFWNGKNYNKSVAKLQIGIFQTNSKETRGSVGWACVAHLSC